MCSKYVITTSTKMFGTQTVFVCFAICFVGLSSTQYLSLDGTDWTATNTNNSKFLLTIKLIKLN